MGYNKGNFEKPLEYENDELEDNDIIYKGYFVRCIDNSHVIFQLGLNQIYYVRKTRLDGIIFIKNRFNQVMGYDAKRFKKIKNQD